MNRMIIALLAASSILTIHATVFLESSRQAQSVNLSQPCIGYLELENSIVSSKAFKQRLKALVDHPLIVGIMLNINSGGGTVPASWEMYEALKQANAKKPIISYIDEICASGAYLAACATSNIVANSMAVVGSIGVVRTIEKIEPTSFKHDGMKGKITIHRFKKGKFKQLGSPYDPMTDEEMQELEDSIAFTHQQFCSIVSEQRQLSLEEIAAQESLTFTGIQALDLGLIDRLGTIDDALALMIQELTTRGTKHTLTIEQLKESIISAPELPEESSFGPSQDDSRYYMYPNMIYASCV